MVEVRSAGGEGGAPHALFVPTLSQPALLWRRLRCECVRPCQGEGDTRAAVVIAAAVPRALGGCVAGELVQAIRGEVYHRWWEKAVLLRIAKAELVARFRSSASALPVASLSFVVSMPRSGR